MPHVLLPLLRVHALPDGTLVINRRQGPLRPTDEGWWRDVLHDPRARLPTAHYIEASDRNYVHYRLDRQRPQILVRCPCGREELMDRDKLIGEVGVNMNVIYLVREWMPCRERNKLANRCRAYVVR